MFLKNGSGKHQEWMEDALSPGLSEIAEILNPAIGLLKKASAHIHPIKEKI